MANLLRFRKRIHITSPILCTHQCSLGPLSSTLLPPCLFHPPPLPHANFFITPTLRPGSGTDTQPQLHKGPRVNHAQAHPAFTSPYLPLWSHSHSHPHPPLSSQSNLPRTSHPSFGFPHTLSFPQFPAQLCQDLNNTSTCKHCVILLNSPPLSRFKKINLPLWSHFHLHTDYLLQR